ncbi:MAG: Gx transporter family protein [Clostridia bacterium]|nr:Gx transporter family protein [Clostridia bacterium]
MSILSRGSRTRRICIDALLCAVAMMLSYLEALLPLNLAIPLPGFRLGLANVIVVVTFSLLTPTDAAAISATRILLMGLLFGSVTSLYFSAMGGLVSFCALLLLRCFRIKCSFVGVSVLSAAAHNTGQIIAAVTLFGMSLIPSYLPLLLFASVLYGGIVGVLLNLLIPRLQAPLARVL